MSVSQQSISDMETKEHLEDTTLATVSKALGVSVDLIKNFNDEELITLISNAFNSEASNAKNCQNISSIEKIRELYEQQIELYRQLIQEKDEKYRLLEQLMDEKK
jgi:hypothetical protein